LPLGTVTLFVDEDNDEYSKHFLKFFLSEGVHSENDLFVASIEGQTSQQVINWGLN